MSKTSRYESAHPTFSGNPHTDQIELIESGLTKREYFAIRAMQGLLSGDYDFLPTAEKIAFTSVVLADALIDELNKKQ